eukprot:TRINITY_DN1360_c0_g1_i20.p1 TRINITY_DN1360_c0_g1~~TRINITY_DN1360_c0_g1_i20.p1  ORF type:complete len:297 (+),score=43.48 TRINITY_DN1360_c0_g1_i20:203-1093(+)
MHSVDRIFKNRQKESFVLLRNTQQMMWNTSTKEILTKSLPTVTIVLFASDFSTVFVAFLVFSDANEEILESECCNNYLCHYCFDDYNSQLAKNPKQEVACSFCGTRDPLYIDVAPNEKIKIYTDSLLQGEQMRSRRTLFGRDLASMNSPSLKAKTQKYIVRDGNLAPDDDGREKLYASDNGIFIKKANQMNLLPDFALSQSKEVAESRKNDDDEDDLNARDIDEEFQPVDEGTFYYPTTNFPAQAESRNLMQQIIQTSSTKTDLQHIESIICLNQGLALLLDETVTLLKLLFDYRS